MSILIKGMRMPSECKYCGFCRYYPENGNVWCNATNRLLKQHWKEPNWTHLDVKRPDWCPLVEIPPHGRLIDADVLKKEYPHDTDWDYPVNTNCYVVESIDNTPTVIEAEEEQEE